jgi:HSP20 family protein
MRENNPLEPFEAFLGKTFGNHFTGSMNIDIEDSENHIEVVADVPGFDREDISVDVNRGFILTISADRDLQESDNDIVLTERRETMSRSVRLPSPVTVEGAEANYNNGVLTVSLPKKIEESAETIPVDA